MYRVAIGKTSPSYNGSPPYHPGCRYPESRFTETSLSPNEPYDLARNLFRLLEMDVVHFGTSAWNPFRELVTPGDAVVIKPNFVLSYHARGGNIFSIVTHPSIIRFLIDYVYIALRGEGRIIVADAPQMNCRWDQLMEHQQLHTIQEFYRKRFGFEIEVYDLRDFGLVDPMKMAYSTNRMVLKGDPAGSVFVDLGEKSAFSGLPSDQFYGADFNRDETIRHHQGGRHEYCVSKTVLGANVFISVPKMKVHKKVGVTLNLKGLVGINTNKNCLVHYRIGSPDDGGDQYPPGPTRPDRLLIKGQRWLYDHFLARRSRWGDMVYNLAVQGYTRLIKPYYSPSEPILIHDEGNWHGNDTAWRMTVDLAKILFYADSNGSMRTTPQRKIFCLVDGIIGGEGNGPLEPDEKHAGCLVAGENPLVVDLVSTRVMGFDFKKLKQFSVAFDDKWDFRLNSVSKVLIDYDKEKLEGDKYFASLPEEYVIRFKPHPAWSSKIEVS